VNRATVERVAVVLYGLVDWLVIMAPSLAVKLAADRGGLGDSRGLDLVIASLVVAVPHAIVAATRLRYEETAARSRLDVWIAAVDALVVLALATTLLIVTVLALFAEEHAALANRGFPIVALWIGLQLVAVALAEVTGRAVFRWLEPDAPPAGRRGAGGGDGVRPEPPSDRDARQPARGA
jgi:hypothetical protein